MAAQLYIAVKNYVDVDDYVATNRDLAATIEPLRIH